jgi:hypothetical protein
MRIGGSEAIIRQLRTKVAALQSGMNKEIVAIRDRQQVLGRWAFLIFLLGTIVMALVLIRLYTEVVASMEGRDAAQSALETLNAELETGSLNVHGNCASPTRN